MKNPRNGLVHAEIVYGIPNNYPAVVSEKWNLSYSIPDATWMYGNIAMYITTHEKHNSQNDLLNVFISLNLNLSSSVITGADPLFPSIISALLSINTIMHITFKSLIT